MNLKSLLLVVFICSLVGCKKENNPAQISLQTDPFLDTIYISEFNTERLVAKISDSNRLQAVNLVHPTAVTINHKNNNDPYLAILANNKSLNIFLNQDGIINTHDKADSLLNNLWHSNNKFISDNSSLLFGSNNIDTIPLVFEIFRQERVNNIDLYKDEIGTDILELLHYQNDARIYSFLFYYGRMMKELEPDNSYFDFVNRIPKLTLSSKSLPDIYLYKYEIEYLRENDAIESITDFLAFIDQKTNNKELADYLRASYIKGLMEAPTYWEKHERLFNTEVLTQSLVSEKQNPYNYLFEKSSSSFYASQSGEKAYLFTAEDAFGNQYKLEDHLGKVIFIDNWATWCRACLHHRPSVLELADKYKNNSDVEILLMSVDSSKEKWLNFLNKENSEIGYNLFIEDGRSEEYGQQYNINFIPKYILIGKDGKIINANIQEPSVAVEQAIENALRMQ